jgi:hypothetical protein
LPLNLNEIPQNKKNYKFGVPPMKSNRKKKLGKNEREKSGSLVNKINSTELTLSLV